MFYESYQNLEKGGVREPMFVILSFCKFRIHLHWGWRLILNCSEEDLQHC